MRDPADMYLSAPQSVTGLRYLAGRTSQRRGPMEADHNGAGLCGREGDGAVLDEAEKPPGVVVLPPAQAVAAKVSIQPAEETTKATPERQAADCC